MLARWAGVSWSLSDARRGGVLFFGGGGVPFFGGGGVLFFGGGGVLFLGVGAGEGVFFFFGCEGRSISSSESSGGGALRFFAAALGGGEAEGDLAGDMEGDLASAGDLAVAMEPCLAVF